MPDILTLVRGRRLTVQDKLNRWLEFSTAQHPVVLQLGGSEPRDLEAAAALARPFGYDEINLNCGCPRCASGRKSRSRETALPQTDMTIRRLLQCPITLLQFLGLRHRRLQRSIAWQTPACALPSGSERSSDGVKDQ